jgi:hypothetical protein
MVKSSGQWLVVSGQFLELALSSRWLYLCAGNSFYCCNWKWQPVKVDRSCPL